MFSLSPPTYAYVTYQDIRRIKSLQDQTVIAVKAPSETKLEVPDPKEVKINNSNNNASLVSAVHIIIYTECSYCIHSDVGLV